MSCHQFLRLARSTPIVQSLNQGGGRTGSSLQHTIRYFQLGRTRRSRIPESAKSPASTQPRLGAEKLPQWLLIYHASKVQTALMGGAKIFAFAWFGFAAAVLAPTFYDIGAASSQALYLRYVYPTAILVASVSPLYVTMLNPRAYVTFVHIAIPAAARASRVSLANWARRIPGTTRVVLTSQRASLNARQTETCMAELSLAPTKARAIAKAEALPGPKVSSRGEFEMRMERKRLPGWQPPTSSARTNWFVREPRRFVVRAIGNESKEKMVWDHFMEQMSRPQ